MQAIPLSRSIASRKQKASSTPLNVGDATDKAFQLDDLRRILEVNSVAPLTWHDKPQGNRI